LAFIVDNELPTVVVFVNGPLAAVGKLAGADDAFHAG
jgi:hypothetical protein